MSHLRSHFVERDIDGKRATDVEIALLQLRHEFAAQERQDGDLRSWMDLCQMILASNAFLYIE